MPSIEEITKAQTLWREIIRTKTGTELVEYCNRRDVQKILTPIYERIFRRSISGCSNCYADALILVANTKINQVMEKLTCDYAMRAGALLQDRHGDDSKLMSNRNITNELAEYHLATNPGCDIFFTHLPDDWRDRVAYLKKKLNGGKKNNDDKPAEPVKEPEQTQTDQAGVDENAEKQIIEKQRSEQIPAADPVQTNSDGTGTPEAPEAKNQDPTKEELQQELEKQMAKLKGLKNKETKTYKDTQAKIKELRKKLK